MLTLYREINGCLHILRMSIYIIINKIHLHFDYGFEKCLEINTFNIQEKNPGVLSSFS